MRTSRIVTLAICVLAAVTTIACVIVFVSPRLAEHGVTQDAPQQTIQSVDGNAVNANNPDASMSSSPAAETTTSEPAQIEEPAATSNATAPAESIYAEDSAKQSEQPERSALDQTPIGQEQQGSRVCPHCKLKNAATATFCSYCGVQIPR